jgi:hypothetical protein
MASSECITMQPHETLKRVRRERRTRREGCYLVEDKLGTYYLVAQKLHPLVLFLNERAPDKASRVSVSALFEILGSHDNRVEGWSKHRWRVRFAPLEEVGRLVERERGRFQHALILGSTSCYTLERA